MLHETTQRRICRIAFLAGCVLPTMVVLAAVAQFWMPSYADRWELSMGRLLDCRVTIQQVRTPTPGKIQFRRIEFTDLEVGSELAVLNGVAYAAHAGKTRISVNDAELFVAEGQALGECIERFLRGHETDEASVSFAKLELLSGTESLSLSDVRARYTFSDNGSSLQIWSPDNATAPRLTIERNRQLHPPATRVTFDTGSTPVPCRFLSAWDSFDRLGKQANFLGQIELTTSRDSVRGQLTGSFSHLHPSPAVVPANFPTNIIVKELRWSTGRPNSLDPLPAGPVEAVLSRFSKDERDSAEQSAGDVAWELAPWMK